MTETADDFLFASCGDGWKEIIRNTDKKLRYIDPDYKIAQIKEKFAGLRYYFDTSFESYDDVRREIMDDVVRAAEYEASRTCELCGASKASDKVEVRVHKYFYFGYCETCADNYIAEADKRYEKYDMLGEL
jgi:hypothetical protein